MNIVTGDRDALAKVLAEHDEVSALWYAGPASGSEALERASAGNLKSTWTGGGSIHDWFDSALAQGHPFLRRATQIKTIWIPYGE